MSDYSAKGWLCPKCGCGVAPSVERCPCALGVSPPSRQPSPPMYPTTPYPTSDPQWWITTGYHRGYSEGAATGIYTSLVQN